MGHIPSFVLRWILLLSFKAWLISFSNMTRTSGYNVAVGLIVAVGSFTYGFGIVSPFLLSLFALI